MNAALPAYAGAMVKALRRGHRPAGNTVIARLDRWPPKDRPALVLWPQIVIAKDQDPAALDFHFLADLDAVVMFWRSLSPPARLRAALVAILAAQPARLIVLDAERGGRAWWVKSVARGVEVSL
ncbi:hypothetical protein C662_02150 [Thauera sp. 28]|uniref:hypothetical protein n=1 Tax=Thauera sp. 28 TaxID=303682 RepID=UPI0002CF2F0E|nr:hypothetical protein [Thauera sp. 28]ENO94313.1 hypothetical protein C662_02150 [Thauera sp. 28]